MGRSDGAEGKPTGTEAELDRDMDRARIERARTGDTEAFRALVEAHRHMAYGLALRILRDPQEAEDAAQEAFVRAWKALPNFRGDARFSTWLHRIVARRALDRLAVLRRRRGHEVAVEEAEVLPGSPGPDFEARDRARRIEALVAALPDAQRVVVTMFYYEGRSVNDVAQVLGMPDGTVKTHLSRARAAMRQAWLRAEKA
jgi:RNA polymerase sigma-70 factor, ECF subfamily